MSNYKTEIQDKNKNRYFIDKFLYQINKDVLKVENLIFEDSQKNIFKTSLAYLNTKTNRIFGKNVNIDLNDQNFANENQPRLKGNSIINDDKYLELTKGVFTTCKKRDGVLLGKYHQKKFNMIKKKIINYKNAVLRIYDFPIMYFPKFYHPDPTVKRQSGFLVPSFNNSINSSKLYKYSLFSCCC